MSLLSAGVGASSTPTPTTTETFGNDFASVPTSEPPGTEASFKLIFHGFFFGIGAATGATGAAAFEDDDGDFDSPPDFLTVLANNFLAVSLSELLLLFLLPLSRPWTTPVSVATATGIDVLPSDDVPIAAIADHDCILGNDWYSFVVFVVVVCCWGGDGDGDGDGSVTAGSGLVEASVFDDDDVVVEVVAGVATTGFMELIMVILLWSFVVSGNRAQ